MSTRRWQPALAARRQGHVRPELQGLEERRLLSITQLYEGVHTLKDVDGDQIQIKIVDQGELWINRNDDTGAFEEIVLFGGFSETSKVFFNVRQRDGGDGRLEVGEFRAAQVYSLNARDVDFTGRGIVISRARHVTIGSIEGDAVIQILGSSNFAGTLRIDRFNPTGPGVNYWGDDLKLLKINDWLAGELQVNGGVGKVHITGRFDGSLRVDVGLFQNPPFRREVFVTSTVRVDGPATGQFLLPRTLVRKLDLRGGTLPDADGEASFSYFATALDTERVKVNGNLIGTFTTDRNMKSMSVSGHIDADVNLRNINRLRIDGILSGDVRLNDAKRVTVRGEASGTLTARKVRHMTIGRDLTGSLRFLQNDNQDRVGVRSLRIDGAMRDAIITSVGDMRNIRIAGGMFNSRIAAGAQPNLVPRSEFPEDLDELKANEDYESSQIKRIDVGYDSSGQTSYEQSYILAYNIDKIKLGFGAPADGDNDFFGVGAYNIGKIKYVGQDETFSRSGLRSFRISDDAFRVIRLFGTFPSYLV
jgi:hypothetical protein